MGDDLPKTRTLSYATPTELRLVRYPIYAAASIVIALLSTVFAALMTFREGLTNMEAREQMRIGRWFGTAGGVLAIAFALVSYRQADFHRILSHLAVVLSIFAVLYILTQLPPW